MGTFAAEPTKDFFLDMLTRDIDLESAILDLIDNSIDGARNELTVKKKDLKSADAYKGYTIELKFDDKQFIIRDNCGGFSKKAATDYAFKFGRPKDKGSFPKGSVGRFGVGMKRGIFKIGNYFIVETKSKNDHFIVEEDVFEWNSPSRKWDFEYFDVTPGSKYKSHKPTLKQNGTLIIIKNIKEAVKQDFLTNTFQKRLIDEIQRVLSYSIQRGLKIVINDTELEAKPIELLISSELSPYYLNEDIDKVNIKIYAGIGAPDPNKAGWYIFCNDRLMVDKDKSIITGWEGTEQFFGDSGVQKFHNKVAMFRGLVFFSADDSSLLPMTTTKKGIDINSTIYKSTRNKMINAMKIVLSYINKLENDEQRQTIVKNSRSVDIATINTKTLKQAFTFPTLKKVDISDNTVTIKYKADRDLVSSVKKSLKAANLEAVGIGTFDYYVKMKEIES